MFCFWKVAKNILKVVILNVFSGIKRKDLLIKFFLQKHGQVKWNFSNLAPLLPPSLPLPILSCFSLPQGCALVGPGLSKNPSLFYLPPQSVWHQWEGKQFSAIYSAYDPGSWWWQCWVPLAYPQRPHCPVRLALRWGPLVDHHISKCPAYSSGIWETRSPLLKYEEFYNPVISLWLRGRGVYEFLAKIFLYLSK